MIDSCFHINDLMEETRVMESGKGFLSPLEGKNEEGNNIDRPGVCI